MKQLLLTTFSVAVCAIIHTTLQAQGCVAIRNAGSSCTSHKPFENEKGWQFSANYRQFKSFRHYRENHEEKERVQGGTDVRNYSHYLDMSLILNVNSRWSFGLNVPLSATRRSSLYEHDGKTRHSTSSVGVGDIRVSAYYWIIDPSKMTKFNLQAGLGLKLATGDYKYQDLFYKNDSTKVLGPVDQSIQLGDGGTGLSTEINAYYNLSKVVSLYGNFYYLINPREQNGTSTSRGAAPTTANIANTSFIMSVPDQFMVRAGVKAKFNKINASVGLREECIPVNDLVGGSDGFRRPGYIISAEQGVNYEFKKFTGYVYVPIALIRNRTQSVPDKIRSQLTGTRTVGDAAFADYSVNVGVSFRFK